MKHRLMAVALLGLLCLPAIGKETGTPGPEAAASGPETDHPYRARGTKRFMLANAEGAVVTVWRPDLTTAGLQPRHGTITLPPSSMEGFHAIVVERDWGDSRETLLRYLDLRGKPSGHSPRELLAAEKSRFEIVPDPLPREHRRYQSGETWGFRLRFDGRPVAGVTVTLTTTHGTVTKGVSDTDGGVMLTLPDDFPDLVEGVKTRRSAGFRVAAEHRHQGIGFQTSLDADYRVSPDHWRPRSWGLVLAGFGLVAGGLLGRHIQHRGSSR